MGNNTIPLPVICIAGILGFFIVVWLFSKFSPKRLTEEDFSDEQLDAIDRQDNARNITALLIGLVGMVFGFFQKFFPSQGSSLVFIFLGAGLLIFLGGSMYVASRIIRDGVAIIRGGRGRETIYMQGGEAKSSGVWSIVMSVMSVMAAIIAAVYYTQPAQIFIPTVVVGVLMMSLVVFLANTWLRKKSREEKWDPNEAENDEMSYEDKKILAWQGNALGLPIILYILGYGFIALVLGKNQPASNIQNLNTTLFYLCGSLGLIGGNFAAFSAIIHRISIVRIWGSSKYPRGVASMAIGLLFFVCEFCVFAIWWNAYH